MLAKAAGHKAQASTPKLSPTPRPVLSSTRRVDRTTGGCPLTDNHPAVTIVVPTLREAPNLEPLAERVAGALAGRGIAWELLLIDDDSDDDTLDVAGAAR